MTEALSIIADDLSSLEITAFLQSHLDDMRAVSPPDSVHALDLNALKASDISFWSLWQNEQLLGCVALKALSNLHGEIKSMRVHPDYRGQGLAAHLLTFVINKARERHYERLSLETGSMVFFSPARQLYSKYGFEYCAPFAAYKADPNSCFMTKVLNADG